MLSLGDHVYQVVQLLTEAILDVIKHAKSECVDTGDVYKACRSGEAD